MSTPNELSLLLEKIPLWKQLVGLPASVRALEERLADLEAKGKRGTEPHCPLCYFGSLKTTAVDPAPLGCHPFGSHLHTLTCNARGCRHVETW